MRRSWIPACAGMTMILGMYITAASAASTGCLEYDKAGVTLTGKISRHRFFGPPNWGEDPKHDANETYWFLDLDKAICVKANDYEDAIEAIQSLQILYAGGYPKGKGWIGHRATVTGTLMQANTGSHHTPVLLLATKTEHAD